MKYFYTITKKVKRDSTFRKSVTPFISCVRANIHPIDVNRLTRFHMQDYYMNPSSKDHALWSFMGFLLLCVLILCKPLQQFVFHN